MRNRNIDEIHEHSLVNTRREEPTGSICGTLRHSGRQGRWDPYYLCPIVKGLQFRNEAQFRQQPDLAVSVKCM